MADQDAFKSNAGINRFANVLADRMKQTNESPLCLDFGEIQANGSLLANTFSVPIPKGEYSICRHVGGLSFQTDHGEHGGHIDQIATQNTGNHTHIIEPPSIKPGDRVLIAWVESEAVVIDVLA